jgi:hypothetical protein
MRQRSRTKVRLSPYKDGGLEEAMRAVTIKALEKFWSITQMPMDEDNKTIVARSFAYIGHILTKSCQPLQISGDLSLFLSNDHQLCYLYLHYECSLRPVKLKYLRK